MRCLSELLLVSGVGNEKFGGKKELLVNPIFILCACDQWCPNQGLPFPQGQLLLAGWVPLIFIYLGLNVRHPFWEAIQLPKAL